MRLNHFFRNSPIIPLLIILLSGCEENKPSLAMKPSPELTAENTIFSQLHALQFNDDPTQNHGVKVVYSFASENFKGYSKYREFSEMIHEQEYRYLINNQRFELTRNFEDLNEAQYFVDITDKEGRQHKFIFELYRSNDNEACGNCWMTEAIIEMKVRQNKKRRKRDGQLSI